MSGKVNILNLKQKSILRAQRTLNYGAKINIKFIKRLTFLQSSQFLLWTSLWSLDPCTKMSGALFTHTAIYIAFRR